MYANRTKYIIKVRTIDGLRYVGREGVMMINQTDATPFTEWDHAAKMLMRLAGLVREIIKV